MKTLLRKHDPEYEYSDILKHSSRLETSVRDILDADGQPHKIFVHDFTGL